MSRFHYDGDEGIPYALWENAVTRSMRSRKGLALLRELKAALEALPEKRLIDGFARIAEGGECEVCALGALAKARIEAGVPVNAWGHSRSIESLAAEDWTAGDIENFGRDNGLGVAWAWQIAYENDEAAPHDPSARYIWMLSRIRCLISENPYSQEVVR